MVIHCFFILTRSGTSIYHKFYVKPTKEIMGVNPAMLCAFFSAMNSFSQNLFNRGLETLTIEDKQFICEDSGDIISIVLIDAKDSATFMRKKLKGINDYLLTNYGNVLQKFEGNLADFKGIEEDFESIILNDFKKTAEVNEIVIILNEILKNIKRPRKKGQRASIIKLLEENIEYFEKKF